MEEEKLVFGAGANASRFVCENAQGVGDVADAAENKKQDADALCAFSAMVEQELGDSRSEVEGGAEVAEKLAPEVEAWSGILGWLIFGVSWVGFPAG